MTGPFEDDNLDERDSLEDAFKHLYQDYILCDIRSEQERVNEIVADKTEL
jgi:hypothetical protein